MSKENKFSKEEIILINSTLIIIPCYNMNSTIQSTVKDLKNYFKHILIVSIKAFLMHAKIAILGMVFKAPFEPRTESW